MLIGTALFEHGHFFRVLSRISRAIFLEENVDVYTA